MSETGLGQQAHVPRPALGGRGGFFSHPAFWLLVVLALTVLVYLVGLHGPYVFDDHENITVPIGKWLNGTTIWQQVVLGNDAGPLHRPLAMLSFVGNAWLFGLDPLSFKISNLLIHLCCGGLIYMLLSRLLPRDPFLGRHASLTALLIAAVWLLHPIQVSTVLYVVQRMAQLSALFMLLALLFFVAGRLALEQGRLRKGLVYLFGLLPVATAAAMLSKENGALVPLLCGVIELGYFRPQRGAARPWSVKCFFGLLLALPTVAFLGYWLLHPEFISSGYAGRTFTLSERLMSEPRALFDYIGALLFPRGPALGIYTDDFVVSHSLLSPTTTLVAIIALVGLIAAAWWSRRRIPAFFTGVGLYLAGHAMESTVFPLLLYFEHRNYLPSVGLFLAVAGLVGAVGARLGKLEEGRRILHLAGYGAIGLVLVLSVATFARARVWGSWPLLVTQGAQQHPHSVRAQMDYASLLAEHGKTDEMQALFDRLAESPNPKARHLAAIDTVMLECLMHHRASKASIKRMAAIAGDKIQLHELRSFELLRDILIKKDCANLSKSYLATIIRDIVDAAPQPETLVPMWRSRFDAADLYLRDHQPMQAEAQAALAWKTGVADNSIGIFLANVYLLNGDEQSSQIILNSVRARVKWWDKPNLKLISELQHKLDTGNY